MRIGEAARTAGVSASTVREWERAALLATRRSTGGHRHYDAEDVVRLRDIRRLRVVQGLKLAAIRTVLAQSAPRRRRPARAPAADAPVPGAELGPRLAALRRSRRMSLRAVSRSTGLAASLISAVEQGRGEASVATLTRLVRCYGTTIGALAAPPRASTGKLIREGRYRTLPMLGPGVRIEQLAEGAHAMDCQRFTVSPGAGSHGAYAHEGEEFVHVLSGELVLTLDGRERYDLRTRDSMYFRSDVLHAWTNPGREAAVLLWINTPPTF